MKRILGLIVAVSILMVNLFTLSVSATISGDFEYWVDKDNVHIVKYIGTAKNLVIPSTIDGYTVTGIGYPLYTSQSIFEKK